MYINATEFRNEFSKYLELAQTEDIIIVRHGEFVARVSGSEREKHRMLREITGSVDFEGNVEDVFKRRMDEP
ncbi:MAG: type II toxin-antitoxin system Phd/YefM family antitoxin [Methanomassiliicoccaceae archaeon]|nr:type II toxin-antitoxin system Phd/YefM family antitoxin [Methanomassiliicoccaceae archaeon]